MENESLHAIGELYLQLRRLSNKVVELQTKLKDQQEQIGLLQHGNSTKGNTPTPDSVGG